MNPSLLARMKRAGCWKLLFGVESGVQSNLDTLSKDLDLKHVHEQLLAVRKAGIETFATFMFGIPGQTKKDVDRTVRFARGLPLDYAIFLNFVPFPGTSFYRDLESHGVSLGNWSTQKLSFVPHSMRGEDLEMLRMQAYRRFYLRFRYILRRLFKIRSWEDVHRNFRGMVAAFGLKPGAEA